MILIREAREEDAAKLLSIYDYYVRNTAITFECHTPTLDEFQKRMHKIMSKYPYLVLEDEGVIYGYAYASSFIDREAYDHSCEMTIYLSIDQRRKGYGRKLYHALEERLKKMGIINLYACIGSTEKEDAYLDNTSTYFHQFMGYHIVGRFHHCGYKFQRYYDMVYLEKYLSNPTPDLKEVIPYPELGKL